MNPILLADRILTLMAQPGLGSYALVAKHLGVSRAKVCYYVALVERLPEDFVAWLRSLDEPDALAWFTERRLRPVTRIEDASEQCRALEELCAGAPPASLRRPVSAEFITMNS